MTNQFPVPHYALNPKRHFLYWLNNFFKLSSQASFMYGYFFQFSLKPFFTPFFPPSVFLGPDSVGLRTVQLNSEHISYFVLQIPSPWTWFNWFHSLVPLHSFHLPKKQPTKKNAKKNNPKKSNPKTIKPTKTKQHKIKKTPKQKQPSQLKATYL